MANYNSLSYDEKNATHNFWTKIGNSGHVTTM